MVADMFTPDEQQHAVLWASLFSCIGSVIGGICGGPIQEYANWRWIFWAQLAFGGFTQLLHLAFAKETRVTSLLDREAKRLRKEAKKEGRDLNIWGPNETKSFGERFAFREMVGTMFRPYKVSSPSHARRFVVVTVFVRLASHIVSDCSQMLATEPIVLFLSLLSGFADALIFMFFESYGYVFAQWNYSPTQISLVLLSLGGAYVLGYLSYLPIIRRHNQRRKKGEVLAPETRLYWLLYLVILLPIGLFICAWIGTKDPVAVAIVTIPIGVANYAIYYATIDYMVECYGPYSASATGGNGFARDFLAGICAIYTKPMFDHLGIRNIYYLLFGFAALFCIPVYIFYWKGPQVRKRSNMAADLEEAARLRKEKVQQARAEQQARFTVQQRASDSEMTIMPVATESPQPSLRKIMSTHTNGGSVAYVETNSPV